MCFLQTHATKIHLKEMSCITVYTYVWEIASVLLENFTIYILLPSLYDIISLMASYSK